jgi:hypothetical protein
VSAAARTLGAHPVVYQENSTMIVTTAQLFKIAYGESVIGAVDFGAGRAI